MDISLKQAVTGSPFEQDLKHIRDALWKNTMAVVVGSGFSRNADPDM